MMRVASLFLHPSLLALGLPMNRGQPMVIAFHNELQLQESLTLEQIRAELRGLGAALILVARGAVFVFQPDDEVDIQGSNIGIRAAAVDELRVACGFAPGAPAHELSLVVLSGGGSVVARHSLLATDSRLALKGLAEALSIAGTQAIGPHPATISRREVVLASLVGAFALLTADGCRPHAPPPSGPAAPPVPINRARKITLNVNGQAHELEVEPRVSLLDALRERLGLTGSKKGCDHGQCGACTVLVAGKRVNACLTLAIMVGEAPVTTIEGLAKGERLHAMQAAFVEEDALQCGYCTPGQIMSALGLIMENRAHTDAEVREHMSGNICRCGAYPNIVSAIQKARLETVPS